jgi:hypothetical protein
MVIIDREGGSYDWGNSCLLMFRKEHLPSSKKEEKLKLCLFGLITEWSILLMVCRKDLLEKQLWNCLFLSADYSTWPAAACPKTRHVCPNNSRSGSGKLAGEKRVRQPKNVFPQTSIYISFVSMMQHTLLQLCKRLASTTLLFLVEKTRASICA